MHKLRVPCAPVRELDEVVNDPHMHERGALQRVDHPELGDIVLMAGALRFGGVGFAHDHAEPALSAPTTQAVFKGWLGLSDGDFDASLAQAGAI